MTSVYEQSGLGDKVTKYLPKGTRGGTVMLLLTVSGTCAPCPRGIVVRCADVLNLRHALRSCQVVAYGVALTAFALAYFPVGLIGATG